MRREALGGIAGVLIIVIAAFAFGGRTGAVTPQARALAAVRAGHFQHVSGAARTTLRCTSYGLVFGVSSRLPGRVASSPLPAERVIFSDPHVPGQVMQIYLLAHPGQASLCARGGLYATSHLPGDGMHDFPTMREWPSKRIDAFTVETGSPPGPGGYWVYMARGRMLGIGGARTRAGASLIENDLSQLAGQISG
jgi:hypothetical protein